MKSAPSNVSPSCPQKADRIFWGILLLALVLRMLYLGRSGLWQDEMGYMLLVRPDLTLRELAQVARDYILSVGQMLSLIHI